MASSSSLSTLTGNSAPSHGPSPNPLISEGYVEALHAYLKKHAQPCMIDLLGLCKFLDICKSEYAGIAQFSTADHPRAGQIVMRPTFVRAVREAFHGNLWVLHSVWRIKYLIDEWTVIRRKETEELMRVKRKEKVEAEERGRRAVLEKAEARASAGETWLPDRKRQRRFY